MPNGTIVNSKPQTQTNIQAQSDMIAFFPKGDIMSNTIDSVPHTLSNVNSKSAVIGNVPTAKPSVLELVGKAKSKSVQQPKGEDARSKPSKESREGADQGKKRTKADKWKDALKSLGHEFALNVLEDNIEIDGVYMSDITRSKLYLDMISRKVTKGYVDDVINVVASENAYHPIKRYLNSLKWDGQDHISNFLRHIHSDDPMIVDADGNQHQLSALLITHWLFGCVARALDGDVETAFKHQTPVLVFVGAQELGKSSMFRWLTSGVGFEYHRESPLDPHNIEDKRSMVTKWIWEVSELGSSIRKSDLEALKGFITTEWHTYRKPWGKSQVTKPTLCNLAGTINDIEFLNDPSGNRRFLPVNVTHIDHSYQQNIDVNQLWAQVTHLYRSGEGTPKLSPAEKEALKIASAKHTIENPLETYLQMYFRIEPGNDSLKCFTAEITARLESFNVRLHSDQSTAGRQISAALKPWKLKKIKTTHKGINGPVWFGIAPNDR